MIDLQSAEGKRNPAQFLHWLKYKNGWGKEHPDYFLPDGLCVFCGPQGSGKTLSAVNYVYKLMEDYPRCKLCTNIALREFPLDEERVFPFYDNDDFKRYNNGEYGVIFLVDEIQLYLNSLQSKNINLDVIAQLSQQRKQRKHIVATSQVFGRMAKPLREQFSAVILCKCIGGCIQYNQLIDRDSIDGEDSTGTNISGEVVRKFVWLHSPEMYGRYETYTVVERGTFCAGEEQKGGLQGG